MHTYIKICIDASMPKYIFIHTSAYIHKNMHTCMHILYIHTYIHNYEHAYLHVCIPTYMHACTIAQLHKCACICFVQFVDVKILNNGFERGPPPPPSSFLLMLWIWLQNV